MEVPQNKLNIELPSDPAVLLQATDTNNRYLCMAALFLIAFGSSNVP
jgi:hypothetical protein